MPLPDLQGEGNGDVVLYCGLGMIMVGLVITVVGLGDKGFQTLGLKLVGPITLVCGSVLACVRILMCTQPQKMCGGGGARKQTGIGRRMGRGRRNGQILTTIVNKEGNLQYEIIKQKGEKADNKAAKHNDIPCR